MQQFWCLVAAATSVLLLEGCSHHHDHEDPMPTPPPQCQSTTTTTPGPNTSKAWTCVSDRRLEGGIAKAGSKGFAVDDATFASCSDELIGEWPHVDPAVPVRSLRLFSGWKKNWRGDRMKTWLNIEHFVRSNNARVLMGLDLKCDEDNDNSEWRFAFELMQKLGADRLMGVAFGNEMDLKDACKPWLRDGTLIQKMRKWVRAMDEVGLSDVKVTVVWSMGVLSSDIKENTQDPFDPELAPFLSRCHANWGDRFVWTFNPYPLWDDSMRPRTREECRDKIKFATGDYTRQIMGTCRQRVDRFTNSTNATLWAGESGWSSPLVKAQESIRSVCPEWGSEETFLKFYENMMSWDLTVPQGRAVDHLFFFTMRDVHGESFGLVSQCCESQCKIQATGRRRAPAPLAALPSDLAV